MRFRKLHPRIVQVSVCADLFLNLGLRVEPMDLVETFFSLTENGCVCVRVRVKQLVIIL